MEDRSLREPLPGNLAEDAAVQLVIEHRHAEKRGDAVFAESIHDALRVPRLQIGDLRAGIQGTQQVGLDRHDVEERQDGKYVIARRERKPWRVSRMVTTTPRKLSRTPLGAPVVPPVYIRRKSESGSRGVSGHGAIEGWCRCAGLRMASSGRCLRMVQICPRSSHPSD